MDVRMPTSVIVRARIDRRLKEEAEMVLAANGLTVSDAFRLMMLRVAEDKVLPFERPRPKPMQQGKPNTDKVTAQMRHHVAFGTHDHFGFSGYRAAIACLYARSEGAAQSEVNKAARELGSGQSGYFNMLRQAKNKWKHDVVVWDDPARGGKVYKLIFNPNHHAPSSVDAPPDWREMNVPKAPPGVRPTPYKPRSGG
jgi:addiction module RelB/DinJ family antitoxin